MIVASMVTFVMIRLRWKRLSMCHDQSKGSSIAARGRHHGIVFLHIIAMPIALIIAIVHDAGTPPEGEKGGAEEEESEKRGQEGG